MWDFLHLRPVPNEEDRELVSLSKRNCSRGWIIFVTTDDNASLGADYMDADVWGV